MSKDTRFQVDRSLLRSPMLLIATRNTALCAGKVPGEEVISHSHHERMTTM